MDRTIANNEYSFFSRKQTLNIGGKLFQLNNPWIMGILNITPDSFYDGGKYLSTGRILDHAGLMLDEGADILDLGAMSTRPGAESIPEEEEKKRLIPALEAIRKHFPHASISVDTYRAEVAKIAVEKGAHIINDVSGGKMDSKMFPIVAQLNVPYIMMHMQGTPANMQKNPAYRDVTRDVSLFFAKQLETLRDLGVNDVILDPGFGFGKTLEHNYQLLNRLGEFDIFELPVMVGVSRKSMINKALGTRPENALNGTTAVHMLALERGANILRVHDVREARETVKIFEQLKKEK